MSDAGPRAVTGRIFEVQRFSIHDGPGIRTTVFLKGCPLRCIWCHNPEAATRELSLSFMPDKCIGCGYCFRACANSAHRMEEHVHVLDRDACVVCGTCAEECYANALEIAGKDVTVGEVMDEVVRDRPFYETSNGGMTLSGGEPLFQIEFTEALLHAAKAEGLDCCVETCGFGATEDLRRLLPLVDLFLFDVKETDPERHKEFTGVDVAPIIENLRMLHAEGATVLLRCPIIPGYNDNTGHFPAVAKLAASLPRLKGVELMPYHALGESKVERFGLNPSARAKSKAPDDATVARWRSLLREYGVAVVGG